MNKKPKMILTKIEIKEAIENKLFHFCTYGILFKGQISYKGAGTIKSILKDDKEYNPLKRAILKKAQKAKGETLFIIYETFNKKQDIL